MSKRRSNLRKQAIRGVLTVLFGLIYLFPLYIAIANSGWNRAARKNGLRPEDLFRKL